MSVEENVFYAKRNIVDSIWKEANIEGIAVTFPQTKEIFEGRVVAGMKVSDTIAINNLKHAWQFVFDTVDVPVDLAYVRQINMLVGQGIVFQSGDLRNASVGIGGTDWRPELPDYDKAKAMVETIAAEPAGQERALHMFTALCRAQLFHDGNKRTAQLVANKMLIADGAGILAIPVKHKARFEELLVDFYETGNAAALTEFLVSNAMDGIEHPRQEQPGIDLDIESKNAREVSRGVDSGIHVEERPER